MKSVVAGRRADVSRLTAADVQGGFRHELEVTLDPMKHPESVEAIRAFIEARRPSCR